MWGLNKRILHAAALLAVMSASEAAVPQPGIVSENPANQTPWVLATEAVPKPHVDALGQIENTIFAGGLFRSVARPGGAPSISVGNFVAFNATSGALKASTDVSYSDPVFDDQVWAIATYGNSVYVGGEFATVNGITRKRLVRINASTGAVDTGFNARFPGGIVWDLKIWKGPDGQTPMLVVSGSMGKRLVALNLTTGADTGYFDLGIADPIPDAWGTLAVYKLAINPAGTKLVATGNFMTVSGQSRVRLFVADLTGPAATLDPWYYPGFAKRCSSTHPRRIAYLQGVDFSPDGSYFVVTATGQIPFDRPEDIWPFGSATHHTVCDAAARFDMADDQRPVWINYTGGDSVWAAAATGAAVYVQGHFQWLDNPNGFASRDGGGASPRLGIGAIDPTTGRALPWAPPKRAAIGGKTFLATPSGLWVGSDSDRFNKELHPGVAFVPTQEPYWEVRLSSCYEGGTFVTKVVSSLPANASCTYVYPSEAGPLEGMLSANLLTGILRSRAQGSQVALDNVSSAEERLHIIGDWTGTIPVTVSMRFTAQVSGAIKPGQSAAQAVLGHLSVSNTASVNTAHFAGSVSAGVIQWDEPGSSIVGNATIEPNAPLSRTVDLTLAATVDVDANDPFLNVSLRVGASGASTTGALETSASQGAIAITLPSAITYESVSRKFLGR
jgi:hypothetical protein